MLILVGPFTFPLLNGFPFPGDAALEELFTRAGGNFTNASLAPKFDDDSLISWKLQAFNELMEVAFFTQLIANTTDRVSGVELAPQHEDYVLNSLRAIQAQEEIHAYNANDAVRHLTNGSHIFPCVYVFRMSTFASAIAFAQTFTDMYIGLLTNIQQRTARSLGADSDSIIYVLGQSSAKKRTLQGKHPSAEPFLTPSSRELPFSWLQRFIVPGSVPGSCPNSEAIPLRIFPMLDVLTPVRGTGKVVFHVPSPVDAKKQSVAFVNGALVPTVALFRVTGPISCGKELVNEIVADFPFAQNVLHGMTLASVVQRGLDFVTAEDVTNATLYGPAVIEVFQVGFQLVSSIGVVSHYPLWSGRTHVPEERMETKSVLTNGSREAKFVCERMLEATLHRYPQLFRVMTARLGQIAGSQTSGYWNPIGHLSFLIKSFQSLRVLPSFESTLPWVPVNNVAGTLTDLLLANGTAHPFYRIDNPVGQPWGEMIRVLADALDIPGDNIIPFDQWIRRVPHSPLPIETENLAGRLVDFLDDRFLRMSCGGLLLDTTHSQEHSPILAGQGTVSAEVTRKYIQAWKEMGSLHL
ncbi:unnamed protein product [Penicillium glandicola]